MYFSYTEFPESTMSGVQSTLEEDPQDDENRRIAEELAAEQQQISIAKFFEKNKHMLGFDSNSRAIVTAVKEAVDNALDAAEEARILPEITVTIEESGEYYKLIVEDNGPGIPEENIPKVFGSLLFGSRFNSRTQGRGQQGIGISAAVMHSQQTSGKPAKVTSKTGNGEADYYELKIDTEENEADIQTHKNVTWDEKEHGTKIVLEMEANMRGRKRLHEYIRNTAVVNPHASITLNEPKGSFHSDRATDELPDEPEEIAPHPHGVDLGTLQDMVSVTDSYSISGFLQEDFTRVGQKTADSIIGLFRDFYYGRSLRVSTDEINTDEFEDAIHSSISRKSKDAKNQLTNCITDDALNQEGLSFVTLETIVNNCANNVEETYDERIGETVRENITTAAWEIVSPNTQDTIVTIVDSATTKRKDDEAVTEFGVRITETLFDEDTRVKATDLTSAVEDIAEDIKSEFDETFGDTSQEKIIDSIWDATDRITSEDIPKISKVDNSRDIAEALLYAMQNADVIAPPTKCLSPITEDLVQAGMKEVYKDADFYSASQRDGGVTKGSPFIVEAGIAYGGDIEAEGKINLQRFGNKVPLVYQPGACAITKTVEEINWRNYKLKQPGGRGLPDGPMVLLVHVASTNIPFTSESKDAIASVEEIEYEIEQAVRQVARDLKSYLNEQDSLQKRQEKQNVIGTIIPPMTTKFAQALDKPTVDSTQSVGRIMNNVTVFCKKDGNDGTISVANYSNSEQSLTIQLEIPKYGQKMTDGYESLEVDEGYAYEWTVTVGSGSVTELELTSSVFDEGTVYISNIEEERLTYNTGIEDINTDELGLIPVEYGTIE